MITLPAPPAAVDDTALAARLRWRLHAGELDLPRPGAGETVARWATLVDWGREDMAFARLAEGHTDAVAVLDEAGRDVVPNALYGVWAARPGPVLRRTEGRFRLDGVLRFCSGAHVVDRALVVAAAEKDDAAPILVDVPINPAHARPEPRSWQTAAMRASDTCDVRFDGLTITAQDIVGAPGWYTARRGFQLGGGGVAAVWWGGAAGLLDRAAVHLPPDADAHRLAHLGELDALLAAARALLDATASAVDHAPTADAALPIGRLRGAVEHVARQVLERVPRMLGPGPLSRDGDLAAVLADLGIYLRQHHGERDHAAVGALRQGGR